jgi:predicted RNA binding protein YcfA (HicA-like mRNA interferase family)
MPKLNLLPAKKMAKILRHLGFQEMRVGGSHHFFSNPITKETACVPIHGNDYLSIGIIKEILRDIDLSIEEYEKLRQKV